MLPPSVHHAWVAGSGAKVRPCFFAAMRNVSLITPGSTRASLASGSRARMRCMYFEKSMTIATLQVWPARLDPQPRPRIGTPRAWHASTVAITSAASRGTTAPIGTAR